MPSVSTSHVFISYSRRDSDAIRRIVGHLRGQGIKAWVDNERLIPGTPVWEEEIEIAIRAAFAIVVVLSPDAKSSRWVRREITLAEQFDKQIFPVLVAGKPDDSVPLRLITHQLVDLREEEAEGLLALSAAVSRHLEELTYLEEERKAEERAATEQDEAQRLAHAREEQARQARARQEVEESKADIGRIGQTPAQQKREAVTLPKAAAPPRPGVQRLEPSVKSEPSKRTSSSVLKPENRSSRLAAGWIILGAIGLCIMGGGIWGISSLLRSLGSSPTLEATRQFTDGTLPESTAKPTIESSPVVVVTLPPFAGKSLVAPDCDSGNIIQSVDAQDRYTVVFYLCRPDPAFLTKIALPVFGIYPEEWLSATAGSGTRTEEGLSQPVGTGPYMIQEWRRGENITFSSNPHYWGTAPRARMLIFRWATDSSARRSELESLNVDGTADIAANDYSAIVDNGDLSLLIRQPLNVFYIGLNNNAGPLSDQRVRQALAMGIDRQRIVELYYPTGAQVATHFVPCAIPNGCAGAAWYDFDPGTARALLAEAGYPDGFATTLYYRDVVRIYLPQASAVAAEIQSQLRENLNIDATLVVMESGAFFESMGNGELNGLHLFGFAPDYPHISTFLDFTFAAPSLQFGDTPYSTIIDLTAQAAATTDPSKAEMLYGQISDAIRDLVPLIPVAQNVAYVAYRADVNMQQANPMEFERFGLIDPNGRDAFVWMDYSEPASLFCADESDFPSLRACAQVMEMLYMYSANSAEVEPALAEECIPNDDHTMWVCALRQGVVFHDGTSFDADDVVATFTMGLDASSPLHVGNLNSWDYYSVFWGLINNR